MDLGRQAPLEAQVAAIADDVAYTNHDLDDGLRAGFFELAELGNFALTRGALAEVEAATAAPSGRA
jgi:dGTPase